MNRFRELLLVLVIGAAGAVGWLRPLGLGADQAAIFGIVMVTLALWATGLVPGYLASLFFFAALLISGLAAPEGVFSGFASRWARGATSTSSARMQELLGPAWARMFRTRARGLPILSRRWRGGLIRVNAGSGRLS